MIVELELVPIEGDEKKLLSHAEREQMVKRIKPVAPEAFAHYNEKERREVQHFMHHLISLSLIIHNDMESKSDQGEHKEHMEKVHMLRRALFEKRPPRVKEFCEIVDITPIEPWLEWEVLIKSLQNQMHDDYYKTLNQSGIASTLNNPFLMHVEETFEDTHMEEAMKGKLTAKDIEVLIYHFSLETTVDFIIRARRVITGQFWGNDYDL